jgi:hypothetical protein
MHDDTDTEASSVHSSSTSSKPAITVSSAATAAAAASATAATVAAAVAAAAVARLSEQQLQQQPEVSSNPASDTDDDNSDSSEDEPAAAAAVGRIASKIRNYTPFSPEASLPAADTATTVATAAAERKRRRAAAAAAAAATKSSNSNSSRSLASTAPASVRSLVGGPASPPLGSGAARPGPVSVRGAGGIGSASRPAFRSSASTATASQSCVDVKSSGRGLFSGNSSSSNSSANVSSTTADGRSHTPLGMGKPRSGAVSVRDMVMRGGPPLSPPESTTHARSKQQQQSQAWAVRT